MTRSAIRMSLAITLVVMIELVMVLRNVGEVHSKQPIRPAPIVREHRAGHSTGARLLPAIQKGDNGVCSTSCHSDYTLFVHSGG